jgi:hypothetical protein
MYLECNTLFQSGLSPTDARSQLPPSMCSEPQQNECQLSSPIIHSNIGILLCISNTLPDFASSSLRTEPPQRLHIHLHCLVPKPTTLES